MKKLIGFIKDFPRKWRAETPILAKWIRNVAGIITAVVPAAWMTFQGMGIELPPWFIQNVGYITFVSLLIAGFAGIKEKKN